MAKVEETAEFAYEAGGVGDVGARRSDRLPPPGPAYIISESGFGPQGRFEIEPWLDPANDHARWWNRIAKKLKAG